MLLRTGKTINHSDTYYNTVKIRCSIIYPLKTVKKYQMELIREMLLSLDGGITESTVNNVLEIVLLAPEFIANYPKFRNICIERVTEILEYLPYSSKIKPKYRKIYKDYFEWLKNRSDYEEYPEVIMKRIQERTKIIRSELIEKLYYPDRYDKMVRKYGEVWADVHLPC